MPIVQDENKSHNSVEAIDSNKTFDAYLHNNTLAKKSHHETGIPLKNCLTPESQTETRKALKNCLAFGARTLFRKRLTLETTILPTEFQEKLGKEQKSQSIKDPGSTLI
ncbi:unnamed protein product, partial [Ceratitis capitata]